MKQLRVTRSANIAQNLVLIETRNVDHAYLLILIRLAKPEARFEKARTLMFCQY